MLFFHLAVGGAAANSYLVANQATKTALLIEGSATPDTVSDALRRAGCTLSAILLTHGHFDHIFQLPALVSAFSCPVYSSAAELPALTAGSPLSVADALFGTAFPGCPAEPLPADSAFEPGQIPVTVYETPGHTKGGVCYRIDRWFFTGDTLLPGSYGRCDLPTGDECDMRRSLSLLAGLLRSLPKDTLCCPGHGDCFSPDEELARNPYLTGKTL